MNHVLILALAATLAHHPVGVLLRGADVQLAGHEAQAPEVVFESDTIEVGPGSSATVKLGDKVVKLSEGARSCGRKAKAGDIEGGTVSTSIGVSRNRIANQTRRSNERTGGNKGPDS